MNGFFHRIAVAIAFSPRIQAVLAESVRIRRLCGAELVLIHVGEAAEKERTLLAEYLRTAGIDDPSAVVVFWEEGNPVDKILSRCKKENVDLLIAGALRKEKLIQYYLGTVARKILRKAPCSVLVLTDPRPSPLPFQQIVVNAENSNFIFETLVAAVAIARADRAQWVHVVKEIKMYGLTMSSSENYTEEEYENLRQKLVRAEERDVFEKLERIPHEGVRINIKLLAGKSGFELARFAVKKKADLLVVGAPPRRFSLFDRMFPHDLEYIFADLPCNLLIVHPRKEVTRG